MLAESIQTLGRYCNIEHPEKPPHYHFPPGYPSSLAALWSITGRSALAAHTASVSCTVIATLLAFYWFRQLYSLKVAFVLGIALAMNWQWVREGGAIRSEPLYFMLGQLAILLNARLRPGHQFEGALLGILLGIVMVTRHIGITIAVAVTIELVIRRQWRVLLSIIVMTSLIVFPWVIRLLTKSEHSQLRLLPDRNWLGVIGENSWFYSLRLPDVLSAPVVEVGTVFAPEYRAVVIGVAMVVTGVLMAGIVLAFKQDRTRFAAILVSTNLGLLFLWPFTEAGRFLVPLVPALLIIALEGLVVFTSWLRLRLSRFKLAILLAVVAFPYSLYAIVTTKAAEERQSHYEVDAACDWIVKFGSQQGPVLSSYPAEVYWQTGCTGIKPAYTTETILAEIERYQVGYLLVAPNRFASAPDDPLVRLYAEHPEMLRVVWKSPEGGVKVLKTAVDRVTPEGSR